MNIHDRTRIRRILTAIFIFVVFLTFKNPIMVGLVENDIRNGYQNHIGSYFNEVMKADIEKAKLDYDIEMLDVNEVYISSDRIGKTMALHVEYESDGREYGAYYELEMKYLSFREIVKEVRHSTGIVDEDVEYEDYRDRPRAKFLDFGHRHSKEEIYLQVVNLILALMIALTKIADEYMELDDLYFELEKSNDILESGYVSYMLSKAPKGIAMAFVIFTYVYVTNEYDYESLKLYSFIGVGGWCVIALIGNISGWKANKKRIESLVGYIEKKENEELDV